MARDGDPPDRWLAALERRHLADLTFQEVRRGLVALSTWYVSGRAGLARGVAFTGAGKRAAFALFYAPLHFLVVRHVVRALDAATPPLGRIVDLGCGTGAASAAWAIETGRCAAIAGYDVEPWALDEARWSWAELGLSGTARQRRAETIAAAGPGDAVLAAWTVNELTAGARDALLERLVESARRGARVLVLEPIARRALPWWDGWCAALAPCGGRADTWRIPGHDLPPIVARLDRAAGLDHRELTARSLYVPPAAARPSTAGPCSKTTSTGIPALARPARSRSSSGVGRPRRSAKARTRS
jgi:hypothetical protein